MSEYERSIENIVQEQEKNLEAIKEKKDICKRIKESLIKIKEDSTIVQSLEQNLKNREADIEKLIDEKKIISAKIQDMISIIEVEKKNNQNSLIELESLETLGEDVTNGINVVRKRENYFDECLLKLYEMVEMMNENYDMTEYRSMESLENQNTKNFSCEKVNVSSLTQHEARNILYQYMCDYNYAKEDYNEYSKDPFWQKIHKLAYPEFYKEYDNEKKYNIKDIKNRLEKSGIKTTEFTGFFVSQVRAKEWNVISGKYHEKYLNYLEHLDDFTYEKCDKIKTINSRLIEGIQLSDYDIEKPSRFWQQHHLNGTKESFLEIAQHISEVQEKINNGTTLSDLLSDRRLSKCTSIYFDKSNRGSEATVLEYEDMYILSSNGRHRILAAQEVNANIPIRIIGKIIKK